MPGSSDFRVGPHEVLVRKLAGRWTATVDGQRIPGFFGTEAQASGTALLTVARRRRDLDAVATGDTLVC